tara:strand:+ start:238 stop:456 length:219 start_codon:yes stop_codon:yes gene_type:complete
MSSTTVKIKTINIPGFGNYTGPVSIIPRGVSGLSNKKKIQNPITAKGGQGGFKVVPYDYNIENYRKGGVVKK